VKSRGTSKNFHLNFHLWKSGHPIEFSIWSVTCSSLVQGDSQVKLFFWNWRATTSLPLVDLAMSSCPSYRVNAVISETISAFMLYHFIKWTKSSVYKHCFMILITHGCWLWIQPQCMNCWSTAKLQKKV